MGAFYVLQSVYSAYIQYATVYCIYIPYAKALSQTIWSVWVYVLIKKLDENEDQNDGELSARFLPVCKTERYAMSILSCTRSRIFFIFYEVDIMDTTKLQPYLDKMKIIFKEPTKKWDMDRYHYGIKIGDEVFNYYGSHKEFIDEARINLYCNNYNRSFAQWAKYLNMKIPTDDDIKTDALYCLVNDYWTYEYYYDLDEFIDEFICEFWYKAKDWIKIYKELEINHSKMKNVFTTDELRLLQELYQDF